VSIPLQLGGGIRDRAGVDAWLEAGVARVILGTAAVRNPALVKEAARAHPGRIVVGIDARDGMVAVEGWAEHSALSARDLAQRVQDAGVAAIVFTDIARDGMMQGVNVGSAAALAAEISIPVIASGGVNGVRDIEAVANVGLHGVVIGRALYDGRLDPAAALAAAHKVKFSR
jgi:phosphoribosylformimino-5-aminoimidazole carboxamide ribotide isomerase